MFNPVNALNEWWLLVKPGGYLILVVPDEDLYEQGNWPSLFHGDHKNTFRLNKNNSWSPVSFDLEELVKNLPNVQIISSEIQDEYYDYQLKTSYPPEYKRIPLLLRALKKIIRKIPLVGKALLVKYENTLFKYFGFPIDQTMRDALAQIQIVAHKIAG
jgi:SAM-dependent methyltransferase